MKFKKEKSMLEKERDVILNRMQEMDPLDDQYAKLCDRLEFITNLEKRINSKKSVNPDTIAIIAASLTEIVLVLVWEEKHVIASKAFGMISKLRF